MFRTIYCLQILQLLIFRFNVFKWSYVFASSRLCTYVMSLLGDNLSGQSSERCKRLQVFAGAPHGKVRPRGRELLCQLSRCLSQHTSTPLQRHWLHMGYLLPQKSFAIFPTLTNGNMCSFISFGFPFSVVVKGNATFLTVQCQT